MASFNERDDDGYAVEGDVLPARGSVSTFSVKKKRRKLVEFKLGGETGDGTVDDHVYGFYPPKNAVMMQAVIDSGEDTDDTMVAIGLTRSSLRWLFKGLSEDDAKRIHDRLHDDDDDLDIDDVNDVVNTLRDQVAGSRPSTSGSGSQRRR